MPRATATQPPLAPKTKPPLRTFITVELVERWGDIPKSNHIFHCWLLKQCEPGLPQEVNLEDFAASNGYQPSTTRLAIKRLAERGLVEVVIKRSPTHYQLIAHDLLTRRQRAKYMKMVPEEPRDEHRTCFECSY